MLVYLALRYCVGNRPAAVPKEALIGSDGEIVRVLRVTMERTEQRIERVLRDDAREALETYLGARCVLPAFHQPIPADQISYPRVTIQVGGAPDHQEVPVDDLP